MTLPDLIARVENGEGADREIDCLVASLCGVELDGTKMPVSGYVEECGLEWLVRASQSHQSIFRELPAYTTSLDAVMALVPDSCLAMVRELWDNDKKASDASVQTYRVDNEGRRFWVWEYRGLNATPARALLAAILRAKEAGQ